jgi:nicotinate-nucleotide pyrophosphorylase (carboxylating)
MLLLLLPSLLLLLLLLLLLPPPRCTMQEAVGRIKGRVDTEASGNVTLASAGAIAATGVTYISVGALTHSVTALDISLNIETQRRAH